MIPVDLSEAAIMRADFEAAHKRRFGFTLARQADPHRDHRSRSDEHRTATGRKPCPRADSNSLASARQFFSGGVWHDATVHDRAPHDRRPHKGPRRHPRAASERDRRTRLDRHALTSRGDLVVDENRAPHSARPLPRRATHPIPSSSKYSPTASRPSRKTWGEALRATRALRQHQGASRLLLRPLHAAANSWPMRPCSCASGQHGQRRRRRPRSLHWRHAPRRQLHAQRPLQRRHTPSDITVVTPVFIRDDATPHLLCRQSRPTTPISAAWHRDP